MMSEKHPFKWEEEGKKAFEDIKTTILNAPMSVTPDFKKDYHLLLCFKTHSIKYL